MFFFQDFSDPKNGSNKLDRWLQTSEFLILKTTLAKPIYFRFKAIKEIKLYYLFDNPPVDGHWSV